LSREQVEKAGQESYTADYKQRLTNSTATTSSAIIACTHTSDYCRSQWGAALVKPRRASVRPSSPTPGSIVARQYHAFFAASESVTRAGLPGPGRTILSLAEAKKLSLARIHAFGTAYSMPKS